MLKKKIVNTKLTQTTQNINTQNHAMHISLTRACKSLSIDAPAGILGSSIEPVRPVRVGVTFVGIEVSEDVHESLLQEQCEVFSLLRCEPCRLVVTFGILQV